MGSTRYKPGESCSAIKKMHIRKRSGFYWIHPPCSQTSIRVFCDFQSDYYQDYYFIQKNLNLKSIQEIEQICANYGLEPYDLTSKAQYDKITTFLMSIKALENDNEMIPIAFDKNSCFNKKCSRNYVSLSSRSSIDYFTWQSENLVSVFPILSEENKNDFLGFDKEKLVPFNLAYSKIKGLLCSTNSHNINEENKNLNDWIKIKCTTSVKYNQEFPMSFSPNANFKIKCPQNCMKFKDKSKVYGSDFYKDDSSICLAAIHNKKMDPEKGGFISIKILEGKRNYIGSRRNEIESLDWEQSLDRYFVIESYENKCPFDRFKLKNDDYLLKDSIKFVEFDSFSNINVDKEEEDVKSNKMQNLERIFQRQKIGLDYFIDITQETKILLENMWNILNKAENKNLFPKIQEDLLNKNTGFFLEVEKNIKKLLLLAKTKLIEKRKKHKLLSKEKNKFLQISDYIEDYSSKIEENWLLSQELKLNKNTHQWSYTLKNVLNHNTTLECTELRKSDLPSIFVLRNKKYYDFLLSFSVMSTNFGIVGSAFRYKDSFNYYVLEISRSIDPLQNFKRIRKIYNGVSSELIRLDDGGFMENIWYRISVKAQRENIEVIINEENNSHKKPVIFRIYDGDLVYGTLTLTTQNITSVYFDHFRVNALECRKVENFLNNAVVYQINTCSRFKELYKADFDFMFDFYKFKYSFNRFLFLIKKMEKH